MYLFRVSIPFANFPDDFVITTAGSELHIRCFLINVTNRNQGVKFEPSSFKLTHEMVVLMGGRYSQGYAMFQHLTVKAYLALRPHADQLINTVRLMLDTGLPSFKGEGTIKRLRDRFALGLSERSAADWMMSIVKNAHENVRSTAYDEFQRVSLRSIFLVGSWLIIAPASKWYISSWSIV